MILLLGTFASQAIVIFQDTFPYPAGVLDTVGVQAWVFPPGDQSYATAAGISASGASTAVIQAPFASLQSWAFFTNGLPGYSASLPDNVVTNFTGTYYYFTSNSPVAALYGAFTINTLGPVTNNFGTYIGMLFGTNFGLRARIYICTNTVTVGNTGSAYRLGILNNSSPTPLTAAEIVQQDLFYGNNYTVVFKYVLSTGLSTLWVAPSAPANETVSANSISPAASASPVSLA